MSTLPAPAHSDAASGGRTRLSTAAPVLEREWFWYCLVALVTILFEILALRLWRADLTVPLTSNSDATAAVEFAKGALETGWFFTNDAVGAPIGQQLYDYPLGGDNLNMALQDVLVQVTRNPVVGTNLFYLAGFPLEAIAGFFCLRSWRVSRLGAGVGGVLFALVPYHFYRAEGHLMLSAYYAVPLGAYLAVRCARGESLWSGRRRYGTAALCVVIASTGLYYAVFGLILVLTGLAINFLRQREWRALKGGAVVVVAIAAVCVANDVPNLIYVHQHGHATGVAVRIPIESETYGLRLTPVVLPDPAHRIAALGRIGGEYWSTHGNGILAPEADPIGLTASIGLLLLVIALVAAAVRPRAGPASLLALLGVLAGTLFLISTTSGVATIFAYVVTAQVRAWARAEIVLAFLGIAATMIALDALAGRVRRLAAWPLRTALFAGVLCLGVLDQTTNAYIPPYDSLSATWHSQETYVRSIERTLPRGSLVYQMPYMPYPESVGIVNMVSYDPFVGYLHSRDLRWSYGAMRGTTADWSALIGNASATEQLTRVAAAGFAAVWVDRNGYVDHGAAVEAEIAKLAGTRPLVDSTGRWATYSLLPLRARLSQRIDVGELRSLGEVTVRPPALTWTGFHEPESDAENTWRWSSASTSQVKLGTRDGHGFAATFKASIASAAPSVTHLTVSDDGTRLARITIPPNGNAPLSLRVNVPLEGTTLTLTTDAPPLTAVTDPRTLYVRLQNVQYVPAAAAAALAKLLPRS